MKKITFIIGIVAFAFISSCSTELDVTGQYKETMVVYGLLDQNQSKQYIKVNKAFLGEGDAFSYAQLKDSVQFRNAVNVVLKRFKNGTQTATYNFQPDNNVPKDAGVFYGPDQTNAIYSFSIPLSDLTTDVGTEFRLSVRNSETGTEATSTAQLLPNSAFNSFSFSPSVNIIVPNNTEFTYKINWKSVARVRLYQLKVRFNYIDSTVNGNVNKYVDYLFPTQKTATLNGNEDMTNELRGQSFLKLIGNQLSNYPDLIARVSKNFEFYLISATDDLSTFIDINAPSTGIIQERPKFTNITNGLGIFSARNNQAPTTKLVGGDTKDELACGQYTKPLKFVNRQGNLCP